MAKKTPSAIYDASTAAGLSGIPAARMRQLIKSGQIPSSPSGEGKRAVALVTREDLAAYIAGEVARNVSAGLIGDVAKLISKAAKGVQVTA